MTHKEDLTPIIQTMCMNTWAILMIGYQLWLCLRNSNSTKFHWWVNMWRKTISLISYLFFFLPRRNTISLTKPINISHLFVFLQKKKKEGRRCSKTPAVRHNSTQPMESIDNNHKSTHKPIHLSERMFNSFPFNVIVKALHI
jgi:hypothetical protein